jgi:hypothetical protein
MYIQHQSSLPLSRPITRLPLLEVHRLGCRPPIPRGCRTACGPPPHFHAVPSPNRPRALQHSAHSREPHHWSNGYQLLGHRESCLYMNKVLLGGWRHWPQMEPFCMRVYFKKTCCPASISCPLNIMLPSESTTFSGIGGRIPICL